MLPTVRVAARWAAAARTGVVTAARWNGRYEPETVYDENKTMEREMKYASGANLRPTVHKPLNGEDCLANPLEAETLTVHQEAEREWMEFAKAIEAARESGADETLRVLDEGLALSAQQGAELRRPGYDASMHLEALEIYRARGDLPAATERCRLAEEAFGTDKDKPGRMTALLQRAKLQVLTELSAEALENLGTVAAWCDSAEAKATPMTQSVCEMKSTPPPPPTPITPPPPPQKAESLRPLMKVVKVQALANLGSFDEAHALLGEILSEFANKKYVIVPPPPTSFLLPPSPGGALSIPPE